MRNQFVYTISCEPEIEGPEGNFATGSEELDDEIVGKIRKDMEWNEWAWCIVKVTAKHPDISELEGVAYLGGCSYATQEDFERGGYYEQMKEEAATELEKTLENIKSVLAKQNNK